MKVFIAGATGTLGRATVPRLVEAGHDVLGIARSPEKADQLRTQGAEPVNVDLFDVAAVRGVAIGADAIVHIATNVPPMSKAWRTGMWATHDRLRREGTASLTQAAREAGVTRFIKDSVCFCYTDQGSAWIDEDSPLVDLAFFAATLDGERSTLDFTGDGRVGVVLRFGLFYGADSRSTEENLFLARKGINPTIGALGGYLPSIHVDDAATAIVAALTAPPGVYNVTDEPITKGEWNAAFAEEFGIDRHLHNVPKVALIAGGKKVSVLSGSRRVSTDRFRNATGWEPAYADARIGLKAAADDYRRNGGTL